MHAMQFIEEGRLSDIFLKERERARERETHTHTHRERERESVREREREREKERERRQSRRPPRSPFAVYLRPPVHTKGRWP